MKVFEIFLKVKGQMGQLYKVRVESTNLRDAYKKAKIRACDLWLELKGKKLLFYRAFTSERTYSKMY